MTLSTNDFDYKLDASLIAQQPLEQRDQSRLLVLRRSDGQTEDRAFRELPSLLRPGDLLVVNDTRVIPARFHVRRHSGGRLEGLFLREIEPGRWEVLLKNAARCRMGEELAFVANGSACLRLQVSLGAGRWHVDCSPALPAVEVLEQVGETPLPPYIRRDRGGHDPLANDDDESQLEAADTATDRGRYQTVYAARAGAVAAPTAGLHFTPELLAALAATGIRTARVTLHVGLGTFKPVEAADPAAHKMHSEWYDLPAETADALNAARREGRRVVAVGTTSVRVLETAARREGNEGQTPFPTQQEKESVPFSPASGWTSIFLYPPAEFRAVDALITNFHLPKSTLLMLVAAFCSPGRTDGLQTILAAYAHAQAGRYRFYSYGDAMLIE